MGLSRNSNAPLATDDTSLKWGFELKRWKWRHESRTPKPESLTGLKYLANLELTPSEVDALEAVPHPSPPTPRPVCFPATSLGPWSHFFGGPEPE